MAHGVVPLKGDLTARLGELFEELTRVAQRYEPEQVAVEGVFTHRNARSALVLGHARGVALLIAARQGLSVHEYAPATIKKTVAGSGRAQKEQVQRMVGVLLDIEPPRVFDAADALAVAICHLQHVTGALPARARSSVVRNRKAGP